MGKHKLMRNSHKRIVRTLSIAAGFLGTDKLYAEYALNFPPPVTPIGQSIYDVHMLTTYIITAIMIFMTAIVVYAVFTFRKDKGYEADQEFHKGWFGKWSWVLIPVVVLSIDLSIAHLDLEDGDHVVFLS